MTDDLPPEEQAAELERRLRLAQERQQKSTAIAGVIRNYLGDRQQVDLEELRSLIQTALTELLGFSTFYFLAKKGIVPQCLSVAATRSVAQLNAQKLF
jgi:hypothetical protein